MLNHFMWSLKWAAHTLQTAFPGYGGLIGALISIAHSARGCLGREATWASGLDFQEFPDSGEAQGIYRKQCRPGLWSFVPMTYFANFLKDWIFWNSCVGKLLRESGESYGFLFKRNAQNLHSIPEGLWDPLKLMIKNLFRREKGK